MWELVFGLSASKEHAKVVTALTQSVLMKTSSKLCTGILVHPEDEGYYTEQISKLSYASTRGHIDYGDTQETGDVEGEEEGVGQREEEGVGQGEEEGVGQGEEEGVSEGEDEGVGEGEEEGVGEGEEDKEERHPLLPLPVPPPPVLPDAQGIAAHGIAAAAQPQIPDHTQVSFDSGQSHERDEDNPRFPTTVESSDDSIHDKVDPLATWTTLVMFMREPTHLVVPGKLNMLDAIGRDLGTQLVSGHMFARYRPGQLVTGMASPDVMCVGGRVHDVVDTYHYERRLDYKVFTASSP